MKLKIIVKMRKRDSYKDNNDVDYSRVHTFFGSSNSMTFHDQKKSNSMTFRTILGNEHIQSKCGNFKEQHNASFKPQIVNKTLLYGNLHITTHNINNKITEIKLLKNVKEVIASRPHCYSFRW